MGQRAGILLKRNFSDGTSRVDFLHHQWAFGKILPAYLMQEYLAMEYQMDKQVSYDTYGKSIKVTGYMGFEKLGKSIDYHYIINGKASENFLTEDLANRDFNAMDVWDNDVVQELFDHADNNNGGMIVEVTEKAEKTPSGNLHNEVTDIKIGFVLGHEECYRMNEKRDFEQRETPFERIVSAREYMQMTGGKNCPMCSIVMFEKFLKTFGIEQVVKGKKKAVAA